MLQQFKIVHERRQAVEAENRPLVERNLALNVEIGEYDDQRRALVVSLLARRALSWGHRMTDWTTSI